MPSKYEKNRMPDGGYVMQYKKGPKRAPWSKRALQFKIELVDITPPVWRRIVVPANDNFWDLHVAIQDAMGWWDSHLHHFEIKAKGGRKREHIGIPDFQEPGDDMHDIYPGWEIPVVSRFNDLGITATYLYDYGDSWYHSVMLEGYLLRDNTVNYPLCLGGARACPPEDCGGPPGYYSLLKTLANPRDEDHEETKEWLGGQWDPEKFDKEAVEFTIPFGRWREAFLERGGVGLG